MNDLAHGREVIDAEHGQDFEFAVELLIHFAVFPNDKGGNGFGALDVRDVKTFDAARKLGKHEHIGEGFLDGLAGRFQNAKALRVGLLGVLAGEVDEGPLFAALRNDQFDAMAGALCEQGGESFEVGKIYRSEYGAWDVLLIDVELLEECGKDRSGA